jgi:hypothetical protein
MKKLLLLLFVFLYSCSPTTMITGSWKSPAANAKPYENILVAALTGHTVAKSVLESDIAGYLNQYEINAIKSIELFPPEISNSDSDRVSLMNNIKGRNIDAILTVSVLRRESETRYAYSRVPYDPYYRYEYYQNFWGYYNYAYPFSYNPAYYTERIYFIETNLYDTKTEKLMWSAQSKTYDLDDLADFSKTFSKSIVMKLAEDGVVKGVVKDQKLN